MIKLNAIFFHQCTSRRNILFVQKNNSYNSQSNQLQYQVNSTQILSVLLQHIPKKIHMTSVITYILLCMLFLSLLNCVPYVLTCLACLRANVLTCQHAYVPRCLACLHAHVPTCPVCLRANVSCVLTCSRALRTLHAHVPTCLACLLVYVPCVLTYSCALRT